MNNQMFREYDIRGIAGKDMTENDVYAIGQAIGTYFKRHDACRVTIGRDCRLSSDTYAEQMIAGLMACGCHITDIGVCPTPLLYFSIPHLHQDGGVMVTASHNPAEYNGFKICLGLDSVHGAEIQRLRTMLEERDFIDGKGTRASADIVSAYIGRIVSNIGSLKQLRVGIDAGNGTAGVIALPILKRLGIDVQGLYCEMDGTFPHHEADPTVLKNMSDLISLVRREKLDVGIGFDGDGDRIGIVDETGRIVFGDRLMILYAREILGRKPGATFISEVKCSQVLYDEIERLGGKAIMWKTGHSLIKKKMKETHAELAGEMSGHMFFADRYFGFDDAIYAACRLLEILSRADVPLSRLLSDLPETCTTPEIRVECPDHLKFEVVKQLCDDFRKQYRVIDIDGARVLFDGGWGLVRASNTQPALVLRFEADSEKRLAEIRDIVEGRLREVSR